MEKDVFINIGIMRYVNGILKFCWGCNLLVIVFFFVFRDDILMKVVIKYVNYDKNLIWDDLWYIFFYFDGIEVKILLGLSDCFIFYKYKDEFGKFYFCVILYIVIIRC